MSTGIVLSLKGSTDLRMNVKWMLYDERPFTNAFCIHVFAPHLFMVLCLYHWPGGYTVLKSQYEVDLDQRFHVLVFRDGC